jgi:hypothetical protein
MNQYPLWKYLLIVAAVIVGVLYALPNLYGEDPSIQISPLRGERVDEAIRDRVAEALQEAGLSDIGVELGDNRLLVRFPDTEIQLAAACNSCSGTGSLLPSIWPVPNPPGCKPSTHNPCISVSTCAGGCIF